MTYKISSFMISMILISVIIVGLSLFMADLNTRYEPVTYDNESMGSYNKLDELSALTREVENQESNVSEKGITDILGGFFSSGYRALKITKGSYDTFQNMTTNAIDQANIGVFGGYLKTAIMAIVLIIIIIAIIIRLLLKGDV